MRDKFFMPILHRYILRETISPFFLSLTIFTGVLFLARILKLVDLVVNKNVPITDAVILFSYVIPGFLEVAIPMALLIGILLSYGRLSSDSELIVIRSCGISLQQLAKPMILLASLCCLSSMALGFWIRPWANYQLGQGLFEILKYRASAGLTAGIFNDFGPLTIYAEKVNDKTGVLNNVLIADRREPNVNRTFIAKSGQIISDSSDLTLTLQLYDGSIQEGLGTNFNYTKFEVNKIKLPESELVEENATKQDKGSADLSISELTHKIDNLKLNPSPNKEDSFQLARYRVEYQKRLAIPTACLVITFAGLALGVQPNRSGRTWGASANITLGISLILVYYILLGIVSAICSQKVAPIFPTMWLPNILFLITGLYWFKQIGNEKWQNVSETIANVFEKFRKFLGGK